ncbi:glycosyltransferase family 9 protein [Hoyosella sp. YIM 151337]|uniref:glycosyltransferase family 9 protein n=1 Tax=Hoyosella sp. YIM 151337 TaxID=2992742 RepID=UPI002236AE73|nr:glycosyltransferase family 9 protein [Hoyosella sp. YIM 151337]MCW4355509.1 glycosyltransferase family 9 protein [Hoyosella sp. YIM 151337]
MSGKTLICRLDNMGDVLLTGPAVRAVAAKTGPVTFLAGPQGAGAARLLPGVDQVLTWDAPWVGFHPPPVAASDITAIVGELAAGAFSRALIFTSFHQSSLPLALLLRMAAVPWIGAHSDDYPGSLLDLRHHSPPAIPEVQRALSLAAAAGFTLPSSDAGELRITRPASQQAFTESGDYLVVHPGASVSARRPSAQWYRTVLAALRESGYSVVVTGGPGEAEFAADAIGSTLGVRNLAGKTSLESLAAVLSRAAAVIVPNTGPAHLAAAVGAPVISLFAPVVPASQWAPPAHKLVILGDQSAPCRNSRARVCPIPGHPCLDSIPPEDVLSAVARLYRTTQIGELVP